MYTLQWESYVFKPPQNMVHVPQKKDFPGWAIWWFWHHEEVGPEIPQEHSGNTPDLPLAEELFGSVEVFFGLLVLWSFQLKC